MRTALRADLVVCTGDLTQLAMEEEFALAREALVPLGERLVLIHGNHDRYPLRVRRIGLYEVYFAPNARCPTASSRSTPAATSAGR